MPIVVVVLGIVIIVMGAALILIPAPKDETPTPVSAEVIRPETVEDTVIEEQKTPEPEPEPEIKKTETSSTEATESKPEPEVTKTETTETKPAPVATKETTTYKASEQYLTPKRTSHNIDVTLTLEDNIVKEVSVVYDNKAGYSNGYQEKFDAAYKTEVIGKSLAGISLAKVGGASLTSDAFNQAVAEIKDQAS